MTDYFTDVTTQTPDPFAPTGQHCLAAFDEATTVPLARRPRASSVPWECAVCGEEREGTVECGHCGA